jgi:hypothetical protein
MSVKAGQAQHLAREASNDWDRGTYVRWTISSAWTAFELACEDATGAKGLGYRFKDKLDGALSAKGIALDWGQGLWQQVLLIHKLRIEYVHPGVLKIAYSLPYRKLIKRSAC